MTYDISEEERLRRSERAKELHQRRNPDGTPVFGGPQPGSGRPRKIRMSEVVADKVRAKAEDVAAAIIDNLDASKQPHIRLAAARQALEVEAIDDKNRRDDEAEFERKNDSELRQLLAQSLAALNGSGALQGLLEGGIVDAELVEEVQQQIDTPADEAA